MHHQLARGCSGSGLTVVVFASAALAHCSWAPALDSDPASYIPGNVEAAAAESADAATADGLSGTMDSGDAEAAAGAIEASAPPSCAGDPPYDPVLMASTSTNPSHRAGEAA